MTDRTTSPRDFVLLFVARPVRLFAYGFIAVVLVLYLDALGFSERRIGVLLTCTLLGGAVLSVIVSTRADRLGRRRMLRLGAVLMLLGGVAMASTGNYWLLVLAGMVGVLSPSGGEVGPFLAIEQACLAEVTPDTERTRIFAWSHVIGFTANALGALFGGWLAAALQRGGWTEVSSYRALLALYGACAGALLGLAWALTPRVEVAPNTVARSSSWHGLHESKRRVFGLGALFTLDAFGGGFVLQSFLVLWFHQRFGADVDTLGRLFFGATLLSGLSALVAVPLARRIGLLNTMVFTHLPSNILLALVPFMPTFAAAAGVLLARHLIAQMDVPTRQSYVNAIVAPDERSAANGITTTVRQIGTALGPLAAGPLLATPALGAWCFVIAGSLKAAYDVVLWRLFRSVKPPEEVSVPADTTTRLRS